MAMRRSSVLNRASIVGLFGAGASAGEEGEATDGGLRELKLKLVRAERENKELRE